MLRFGDIQPETITQVDGQEESSCLPIQRLGLNLSMWTRKVHEAGYSLRRGRCFVVWREWRIDGQWVRVKHRAGPSGSGSFADIAKTEEGPHCTNLVHLHSSTIGGGAIGVVIVEVVLC